MRYEPPAIDKTAFNCPHCGALTSQEWFSLMAKKIADNNLPNRLSKQRREELNFDDIEDSEDRKLITEWADNLCSEVPFIQRSISGSETTRLVLGNVNASSCFNCKRITVWIGDQISFPAQGEAPMANADLPSDVRRDYDEASSILSLSPRGAAALLRLAIQKLCKELGESGNDINRDIGALVRKGLDVRVQKALDAVRVIGNNAVHPGEIDLRDDRATAESLFRLLNLIADKMISEPKHVDDVYANLPPGALASIEKRDKPNS